MIISPTIYKTASWSVFLLLSSSQLVGQSEIGILQTNHLVQSVIQGNPANFTDFRFNLALPSVYVGASNSGFSAKEVLQEVPGGYRLQLDPALANLKETGNHLGLTAAVQAGALSFQVKRKVQFTFFQTTQLDVQLQYPKALPELLWRGNYPLVGQALSVGPQLNVLGYNAYGGGLAFKVGEKVCFGANLKLLTGLLGIQSERNHLVLETDPEYYQLSLESDWLIKTAGLNDLSDEQTDAFLADTRTSYFLNSKNYGVGADVGLTWQASPKWKVGLSVKDLGSIRWTQHAYALASKGNVKYEGATIQLFSEENENLEGIGDSIAQLLEVQGTKATFSTRLPLRSFLTTSWTPTPSFSLGTTFQYRSWYGHAGWYASAQLQQRLGRVLYVGVLMGYGQYIGTQWGANASLRLGPFQFYALTDSIMPLLDPFSGKSSNLRMGMNLAIGK